MKAVGLVFALIGLVFALGSASVAFDNNVVETTRDLSYYWGTGYVDILRDTKQIAQYVYKDTPKPYIYPLKSLGGIPVTKGLSPAGATDNYPNHRSFWIGLADVNGVDFWNEGEKCGKIVQTSQEFDSFNAGYWNLHCTYNWVGTDGKVVLAEERRNSFLSSNYGLLTSTMITLKAGEKEVKLGDTADGLFALRVAPGIQLKGGKGHILNSNGEKDNACLGKRAKWCDYTGEVDGKTVGIAVFDVPANYGFPTYWNVTDYGLLAANPFGGKSFTGDPEKESSYIIKPGQMMTFVYVILIHENKLDKDALDWLSMQLTGSGQEPDPESIEGKRLKELDQSGKGEVKNASPDK